MNPRRIDLMNRKQYSFMIGFCLILLLCINQAACVQTSENNNEAGEDSVFKTGSWALYDIKIKENADLTEGTLKVAVVGKEKVNDKDYYWLELVKTTDDGKSITRMLTTPKENIDYNETFVFWDDVNQVIIQQNDETPKKVSEVQIKKFIPNFVESGKTRRFGNAENITEPRIENLGTETMEIDGKTLETEKFNLEKRFVSRVNLGFIHIEDTTESSSAYWRSDKVPFGGLVKVIHTSETESINKKNTKAPKKEPEQYESAFMLKDFGHSGAVSAIQGDPEEMEGPVFPFLQKRKPKKVTDQPATQTEPEKKPEAPAEPEATE